MQPVSTSSTSPGLSWRSTTVPAGVDENHTVSFQFLHDETLAAEQAGENFFLHVNADGNPFGGAQGNCPSGRSGCHRRWAAERV